MPGWLALSFARLRPSRCDRQDAALRWASTLHALSSFAVGNEARKTEAGLAEFKTAADAAERRSLARGLLRAVI